MATRFYINNFWTPPDIFDADASWDVPLPQLRRLMLPFRNDFQVDNESGFEGVTTDNYDIVIGQFYSPPLQAQTITGTFHGAMMARENNASANMRSQCVVRVIAPDGTVRGTLISPDTGALANEWTASTTAWRNARFPKGSSGASVTSVNALAGDRIVVEVGFRAHNTSNTAFTGTIRTGNGQTNTDLPSNDTQTTGTTDNPWFEFSQTLNFDVTEYEIFDDIADAVDALPDPLEDRFWRESDFSSFTTEGDDPTEITFDPNAVTGWVRLDGPATGQASLEIFSAGGGHESWPYLYVYDEVPTSASTSIEFTAYDDDPILLTIPAGEFRYLGLSVDITWPGMVDDIFFIVRRVDSGDPTGDIKDLIADAVDVFPASMGDETESETTNLSYFTTEADDPTEFTTYSGNALGYTGWLKLVVPTEALTTISLVAPTDEFDLTFWLYDEVPTSSSVAIHFSDDDDPFTGGWPYLPEITLPAGTYYLLITPFDGAEYSPFDGTQVTVRIRWEFGPTEADFSVDSILKLTVQEPYWVSTPTYVDVASATVDDAVTLDIDLSGLSLQVNDLLLLVASVDLEGNISNTLFTSMREGGVTFTGNGFNVLASTEIATDNHRLWSGWHRWRGIGDSVHVSTISSSSTAKAGAVMVFRNAGTPIHKGAINNATVDTSDKATVQWSINTNDINYERPILMAGSWAGGRAGVTTWTTSMTERADVSATANASLMVATWADIADTFVESRLATPSAAEFMLTHVTLIAPYSTTMAIDALVQPGAHIPFDAVIAGPISTKHDRTRYHYGVTPAENIISSRTYGAFPPGTTLQEVLEGLDTLITDLENQS